jgi:putative proteasome-type protease
MTYCVGIMLDAGLILASDSRTHAEVDNFARFCKMTVFDRAGDRVIVLLSSGNLAGTQAVISLLKQRCAKDGVPNLWSAVSLFDAAMLVSDAMRDVDRRDGQHLTEHDRGFNASFILAARSRARRRVFSASTRKATSSRQAWRRLICRRVKPSTGSRSSIG